MKDTIIALAFVVSVFCAQIAHAQVSQQVYPVTDTAIKSFDRLIFNPLDTTIRHYDNSQRLDLFVGRDENGWVSVFTFSYDAAGTRKVKDRVNFIKCNNGTTKWCVGSKYEDETYIPTIIKKVVETLSPKYMSPEPGGW